MEFLKFSNTCGSCVRDIKSGEVFERNSASFNICGEKEVCESSKICREIFESVKDCLPLNSGVSLKKNVQLASGVEVDVILIPEGENIRTLVFKRDSQDTLEGKKKFLEDHNLTKSEISIMLEVLMGKTNQQIADQFFISKATLKTHLNNIYKKLPAGLRPHQNRSK